MESTATNKMSSRRPPLHTCGLSLMEIAEKAYKKAQQVNGPLGSMANKIGRIASPFVYALEYQLLVIFSFLDDGIFSLECVVEAIFPSSGYVFNKIDEFVRIAEILPGKFDEAMNKFPAIIHRVPFVDWALFHAISCLDFFLSVLIKLGTRSIKEKEIVMDKKCNESSTNKSFVREVDRRIESQKNGTEEEDGDPTSEAETGTGKRCSYKDALEKVIKATYKDALEKGTKENTSKKEEIIRKEEKKENGPMAETEIKSSGSKKATKEEKLNKEKKEEIVKNGIRKSRSNKDVSKEETRKNGEKSGKKETKKSCSSKEINREEGDRSANLMDDEISNGDQILALFDSAWLAIPQNKRAPNSLSRSVSYQL